MSKNLQICFKVTTTWKGLGEKILSVLWLPYLEITSVTGLLCRFPEIFFEALGYHVSIEIVQSLYLCKVNCEVTLASLGQVSPNLIILICNIGQLEWVICKDPTSWMNMGHMLGKSAFSQAFGPSFTQLMEVWACLRRWFLKGESIYSEQSLSCCSVRIWGCVSFLLNKKTVPLVSSSVLHWAKLSFQFLFFRNYKECEMWHRKKTNLLLHPKILPQSEIHSVE